MGRPPGALVEAVLGAVAGAQPPVVLQVVVPQQPAQDVQELVKADLVVLVLVRCPEQLGDEVRLLPALGSGQGVSQPRALGPEQMRGPPPPRKRSVAASQGLAGSSSSLPQGRDPELQPQAGAAEGWVPGTGAWLLDGYGAWQG